MTTTDFATFTLIVRFALTTAAKSAVRALGGSVIILPIVGGPCDGAFERTILLPVSAEGLALAVSIATIEEATLAAHASAGFPVESLCATVVYGTMTTTIPAARMSRVLKTMCAPVLRRYAA